jgi:hypothetical protein
VIYCVSDECTKLLIPCLWMLIVVPSQQLYQNIGDKFCFPINLGMKRSGINQFSIHPFPKNCEFVFQKPTISIKYDGIQQSKMYPNMNKKSLATSHPVIALLHKMSTHIFLKWSTMTNK